MEIISVSDLLQANVTIIAGVLVLLTISIAVKRENAHVFAYMAFSPILFVLSAGLLVMNSTMNLNLETVNHFASLSFVLGLVYMMIAVVKIVIAVTKS